MDLIKANFQSYVAQTGFEELARRFIVKSGDNNKLSFIPDYVGRIWNKQTEIDVAAINHAEKIILLGECKWTTSKVGENVLDELIQKVHTLNKIKDYTVKFVLFSKNGFTGKLIKRAKKDNTLLFVGGNFKKVI